MLEGITAKNNLPLLLAIFCAQEGVALCPLQLTIRVNKQRQRHAINATNQCSKFRVGTIDSFEFIIDFFSQEYRNQPKSIS